MMSGQAVRTADKDDEVPGSQFAPQGNARSRKRYHIAASEAALCITEQKSGADGRSRLPLRFRFQVQICGKSKMTAMGLM
jgi:hypothetical protein